MPITVSEETRRRVRRLDRAVVVHILEKLCSIQCRDSDSDTNLQDNIILCIEGGDIRADDIPS